MVPTRRQRRRLGHPGKPTSQILAPNDVWSADYKRSMRNSAALTPNAWRPPSAPSRRRQSENCEPTDDRAVPRGRARRGDPSVGPDNGPKSRRGSLRVERVVTDRAGAVAGDALPRSFAALPVIPRRNPTRGPAYRGGAKAVPHNPQIQYHLGVVYTGHGRKAQTLESARSAEDFADAEAPRKPPSKLP